MQPATLDADHEARTEKLNQVKKRLKDGWRHEPKHLRSYFNACSLNWRLYAKPKTQRQVLEAWAIYTQATKGDCPADEPPASGKPSDVKKWAAWYRLLGMPREMAMRRFITYMAEIDPELIDVVPSEKPPFGFPLTEEGETICAKCNTAMGCVRPLLDFEGNQLKTVLFNDISLHNPAALSAWFSRMSLEQRCVFGVHRAITAIQAKPFLAWFNRTDNGGFVPYDASTLQRLIKEFVKREIEILFQMQVRDIPAPPKMYEAQIRKIRGLKEYYHDLTDEEVPLEIECSRDIEACNRQRLMEGVNHTHTVDLPDPDENNDDFEEAVRLRNECAKYGLSLQTGVCTDTRERCQVYRERLQQYHERQAAKQQAILNLQARRSEHPKQKAAVAQLASVQLVRRVQELLDSCNEQLPILQSLLSKGAPHDVELRGRVTPLIRAIIGQSIPLVEVILASGADADQITEKGATALMVAAQLDDEAAIRFMLQNGATIHTHGSGGRTAMHVIASQGSSRALQAVMLFVEQQASAQLRLSMVLDHRDKQGNTPLMAAVMAKNMAMCKALVEYGADANLVNGASRTAAHIGRSMGSHFIAAWLEAKSSGAIAGVETQSDRKLAKQLQFAHLRLRDAINTVCQTYDRIVLEETGMVIQPFTPPLRKPATAHFQLFMRNTARYAKAHQELLERDADTMSSLREAIRTALQCVREDHAWIDMTVQPKPFAFNLCMCVAMLNDVGLLRELVDTGADVCHANQFGTTPLMVATLLNNHDAMIALLEAGADVHQEDLFGNTCFAYASARHHFGPTHPSVQNVLLAELEGECNDEPTATALLMAAKAQGAVAAAKLLQSHRAAQSENSNLVQLMWNAGLSRVNDVDSLHALMAQAKVVARERELRLKITHDVDKSTVQPEVVRCPLCTLPIPCNHFSTAAQLLGYKRERKRAVKLLSNSDPATIAADLLNESHIAPRTTDRSITWTIYRRNCKLMDDLSSNYKVQGDTSASALKPVNFALPQSGGLIQISRRNRGARQQAAVLHNATGAVGTKKERMKENMSIGQLSIGEDNPVPTARRKVFMFAELASHAHTQRHQEAHSGTSTVRDATVLLVLNRFFFETVLPVMETPPVVDAISGRRQLPSCARCGLLRVRAYLEATTEDCAEFSGTCVACQFDVLTRPFDAPTQALQSNDGEVATDTAGAALQQRLNTFAVKACLPDNSLPQSRELESLTQESAQADATAVCAVLIARGQFHEGRQMLQAGIEAATTFGNATSVVVADMLEVAATVYCFQGMHYRAALLMFEAVELLVERLGFDDTRTKQSIRATLSLLLHIGQDFSFGVAAAFMRRCRDTLLSSRIRSKQLLGEELWLHYESRNTETAHRRDARRKLAADILASPEVHSRDYRLLAVLETTLVADSPTAAILKQHFEQHCHAACNPVGVSATHLFLLVSRYEVAHLPLVRRQLLEDIVKHHLIKKSDATQSLDDRTFKIELPAGEFAQFEELLSQKDLPAPGVFDSLLPPIVQQILPSLEKFCRSEIGVQLIEDLLKLA